MTQKNNETFNAALTIIEKLKTEMLKNNERFQNGAKLGASHLRDLAWGLDVLDFKKNIKMISNLKQILC